MHRGAEVFGLFACLTLSTTALAVDLPFAPATTIEGEYAWATAVETGDIDGDGVLDCVVVAESSASDCILAWYENSGDQSSTVLVTAVEDLEIFSDGFETGDTSEWSSAVGGLKVRPSY